MKLLRVAVCGLSLFCGPAFAGDAAATWAAKCKSCHGEDGRGDTAMGKKNKVRDISTAAWQAKNSDADIKKVIADGSPDNPKMKAYKDKLSAEDISALVTYVRGLKK